MPEDLSSLFNDRYEMIRLIGKGATGMVYLAYDSHLDREVAIKVLDQSVEDNEDVLNRFEQEVRITARLQHPGVVAVFESGYSPDQMPCYAMSLALGETLEDFLNRMRELQDPWKTITLIERLNIFIKLLEVMDYAHSENVVHRDIKPANIILGEYGEVRVLDWGLGRILNDDNEVVDEFDEMFGGYSGKHKALDTRSSTSLSHDTRASDSNLNKTKYTDKFAETLVPGTAVTEPETRLEPNDVPDDYYEEYNDQTDVLRPNTDINTHQHETELDGARETTSSDYADRDSDPISENPDSSSAERRRTSGSYDTTSSRHRDSTTSRVRRRSGRHDTVAVERRTRHGEILGSPAYMSPEQARGEADTADRRTDIYSLGVLLFELLTLETPLGMEPDEKLSHFIERVIKGKRKRRLEDLWPSAPKALCKICKRALARSPSRRFRTCNDFMTAINQLLDELSASYSELERQRLERERQGAWIPVGSWDYGEERESLRPFTEMVTSFEGESVGQMLDQDRRGMVLGGCGLQIYPCAVNVGDDIRISMDFTFLHGTEIWIFLRGMPPVSCYAFRIGSYNGQWLTVSRIQSVDKIFQPEMLTMRALTEHEMTLKTVKTSGKLKRQLTVEVVESSLSISIDGHDPLIVQDPCPLMGPMHQQLALGTMGSQIVVHQMTVEQRRSPLMLPSYAVANELLRQNLYPQAITHYQKFLEEQRGRDESVEAHFMLCLAFLEAGHIEQSEQALHNFLLENMDNALSRDAIFELARLKTGNDYKKIESGVRVVLSYQEADDRVRSRYCLWACQLLHDTIYLSGIDDSVVEALRLLKHLIRGFSDEQILLKTISDILVEAIQDHGARLIDFQATDQFDDFKQQVVECRAQGYALEPVFLHSPIEYVAISRELNSSNRDISNSPLLQELHEQISARDIMCLSALGNAELLIALLESREQTTPLLRLCLSALYARQGKHEEANKLFDECFRLMDIMEQHRTDIELTTVMRLGMYAMSYLPWEVVWPPISQMTHEPELQVLAAWMAECIGQHENAAEAYVFLRETEALGFRNVVEQGLTRLGMLHAADEH